MPYQNKQLTAFVMMRFADRFIPIYECIGRACQANGVVCSRVDKEIFTDNILDRVYKGIRKADILIGEMTGHNPNVFYEIGYAHALKKEVILIGDNTGDIPFDFQHYPVVVYKNLRSLRTKLGRAIRIAANSHRPKWIVEMAEDLDEYFAATRYWWASFERLRPYVRGRARNADFEQLIEVMGHKFAHKTIAGGKPGLMPL